MADPTKADASKVDPKADPKATAKKTAADRITQRIDARKVNSKELVSGESHFAISGPGVLALRVIRRDPATGIIQFDKPELGLANTHKNLFTQDGVTHTPASAANLMAWLDGTATITKENGLPAEMPKDKSAEVEFQDARGWVNAKTGEVNDEPFDELA